MYDNTENFYTYVFVRTDIPLANQIVQTAHACQEAGNLFDYPKGQSSYLILFQVKDEKALMDAVVKLQVQGIRVHAFFEPDFPEGYTAACSEPVQGEKRKAFQKFKLWR